MATSSRIRVAVLFGGRSTEHSISCVSAGSVLAALDRDVYDVLPVGITPQGTWVLAADDPAALAITGRELPEVAKGSGVLLPADPTVGGLIRTEPGEALDQVDVVFPLLHGAYGEDGTVQGLLEMAGIPYVGAGVLASAVCMDKEYTKRLLAAAGLPVGEFAVLRPGMDLSAEERDRLGLPVFVKPARAGSSIGISRVTRWDQWDDAVSTARAVDPKLIVEAAVTGREVECGVLEGEGGDAPQASVLAEIRLGERTDWYDFEAKYLDEVCEFDIPAHLPEQLSDRVRATACQAFTALDCAGLARVDFFVGADGTITLNEVNTMPGFTPISMFPRMWAATGLDYPSLLDRLVRTALHRGTGLR